MASGLLFQVVIIVTLMMFSKMTVGEADPLLDTNINKNQHRCFFDPFLQLLHEMNLRFLGYILRRLLCPALNTINPVEETCPKPVDWNQPKMYVSYTYEEIGNSSIGTLHLVNGKYELDEGDETETDSSLTNLTPNKAGDKMYATEFTNITIYTRNPCSYKFEKTHTKFIGPKGFLFFLDPSEKYLIVGLRENTAITSYRLEDNGTMFELGFIVPQNEPGDTIAGLDLNTKFNLVAAAKFISNQIKLFNYDSDTGKLTTLLETLSLKEGVGVLDLVFSSDGRFLYVMGTFNFKIVVFEAKLFDEVLLGYTYGQEISFIEQNQTYDYISDGILTMHPNGTYLYSLYLSSKAIAVYSINKDTGELILIELHKFDDKVRNFSVSPKGDQLLVISLFKKIIQVFNIEGNGTLTKDYEIVTENRNPDFIV